MSRKFAAPSRAKWRGKASVMRSGPSVINQLADLTAIAKLVAYQIVEPTGDIVVQKTSRNGLQAAQLSFAPMSIAALGHFFDDSVPTIEREQAIVVPCLLPVRVRSLGRCQQRSDQ